MILRHLQSTLRVGACDVVERWTGTYPTFAPALAALAVPQGGASALGAGAAADCVIEAPDPALRVVVVTSGTGASTAFGIAEEVFDAW